MKVIHYLFAGCFWVLPVCALAQATAWKIIPAESTLTFTATQNNAPISGEFKRFNGNIHFDRDKLQESNVDMSVDMNSLATSYSDLTMTLRAPDWFNTKVFPTATFKATEFIKTADKHYQATGTLTIRDHAMPLSVTFIEEPLPTKDKVRVIGEATLKRTAFGVGQGEWVSTNEVKDDVIVHFVVTAVKK